jgi:hypothetical protein
VGKNIQIIHLYDNICRILFCKRLVNETICCYKIFAENLLPGSRTANPHYLELEMLTLVWKKKLLTLASFEESLIWFCIVIPVYQVEEHNLHIFSSEVLQLFMS